jgi:hypothetical protein
MYDVVRVNDRKVHIVQARAWYGAYYCRFFFEKGTLIGLGGGTVVVVLVGLL